MKKSTEIVLGGPLFANLTGSRRTAYIHQWVISVSILLVSIVAVYLTTFFWGSSPDFVPFILVVLGLQFLYALVRRETIWQLRIREVRYRAGDSKANTEELLRYGAELKRKAK